MDVNAVYQPLSGGGERVSSESEPATHLAESFTGKTTGPWLAPTRWVIPLVVANECKKLRASLFDEVADFLDVSHDFVDLPFGGHICAQNGCCFRQSTRPKCVDLNKLLQVFSSGRLHISFTVGKCKTGADALGSVLRNSSN